MCSWHSDMFVLVKQTASPIRASRAVLGETRCWPAWASSGFRRQASKASWRRACRAASLVVMIPISPSRTPSEEPHRRVVVEHPRVPEVRPCHPLRAMERLTHDRIEVLAPPRAVVANPAAANAPRPSPGRAPPQPRRAARSAQRSDRSGPPTARARTGSPPGTRLPLLSGDDDRQGGVAAAAVSKFTLSLRAPRKPPAFWWVGDGIAFRNSQVTPRSRPARSR